MTMGSPRRCNRPVWYTKPIFSPVEMHWEEGVRWKKKKTTPRITTSQPWKKSRKFRGRFNSKSKTKMSLIRRHLSKHLLICSRSWILRTDSFCKRNRKLTKKKIFQANKLKVNVNWKQTRWQFRVIRLLMGEWGIWIIILMLNNKLTQSRTKINKHHRYKATTQ